MQEYKFRIFPNDDYQGYLRAMAAAGFDDAATNQRRKWWCFDNPNGGAFAAALMGDSVAATCYISGKSLVLNGINYKAYEIGETFTAASHQRKGLFSRLVKACTKYAFDQGASAVYGTPNAASTPGYAKLKFEIIADQRSHLFLSPNIIPLLKQRLTRKVQEPTIEYKSSTAKYSISSSDFFLHSKHRPRINVFSEDYFNWRFKGLQENRYMYFQRGDFSMSARPHTVGKDTFLMLADFGFSKSRPSSLEAISEIREILDSDIKKFTYSGIYFLSDWNESHGRMVYGLKKLTSLRPLPICVLNNGCNQFNIDLRSAGLPQLSDCDMC